MGANKIREIREKVGMTQIELARRAHIHPSNLSALEHGKLAPWPKVRRALARILKCSQDKLFPLEEKVKSNAN